MPLQSETRKKTCSPPKLNKLTPEQANLILIGHASCGDQGAKTCWMCFARPNRRGSQCSRAFRGRGTCPSHT